MAVPWTVYFFLSFFYWLQYITMTYRLGRQRSLCVMPLDGGLWPARLGHQGRLPGSEI
jgi:hypothetical protein